MKKNILLILSFSLISNFALADCDFKDLIHNADGTVVYSKTDHVCVGQLVQDNATKDQQIVDYKKALTLKDLVISTADQRGDMWRDTALKIENNINTMEQLKKTNEILYFGLGILTVLIGAKVAHDINHL